MGPGYVIVSLMKAYENMQKSLLFTCYIQSNNVQKCCADVLFFFKHAHNIRFKSEGCYPEPDYP